MESDGKTIELYLMDDTPAGRWHAEIYNWIGRAYKIPRKMLDTCDALEHIHSPGVYFLFERGTASSQPFIYIGEGEDVLKRVRQHHGSERYGSWEEAIIFVATNGTLEKGSIQYLEKHFYTLAISAGRYHVKNGNTPKGARLTPPKKAALNAFIDNASLLTFVLGHHVFIPLNSQASKQVKDAPASKKRPASSAVSKKSTPAPAQGQNPNEDIVFHFEAKKIGLAATGRMSGNGFIVFKGSSFRQSELSSCEERYQKKRRELIETGKVKDSVFVEDTFFDSPSGAVSCVNGGNESGNRRWIAPDGRPLGDFRKNT